MGRGDSLSPLAFLGHSLLPQAWDPKSTVSQKADSEKGGLSAGQVVSGASQGVGAIDAICPPAWGRGGAVGRRCRPAVPSPGPAGHTHSLWFKSTLLLFLRLLLSTKKRWPAKPFFFLLLPGKTGHREWYITDLQTWRENGQNALQRRGSVKNALCSS